MIFFAKLFTINKTKPPGGQAVPDTLHLIMKSQTNIQQKLSSIFLLTTIILIGLMIALSYGDVSAAKAPANKTLLILGDSLSAGYGIAQGSNWTDLLQKKLDAQNKQIQLINASISGDTTANGLNRLPKALDQFQPELVLIELGANDGLRGLSLRHIRSNLELLIQSCLTAKAEVFLMEIIIPPNYGKKYTRAFKQIYHDLAKKYSLTLLPFLLENIAVRPELMQVDGLHPNEKAQNEISEGLWLSLEPIL